MLTEKLLHFIWRFRLYDAEGLLSREGEKITVLHPGELNHHAGPDFLEAKIRIGATLWVGHVELHLLSSDWNKHHHEQDARYERLILHVVFHYDTGFQTRNNSLIPVLELKDKVDSSLVAYYQQLMEGVAPISCSVFLPGIEAIYKENQLDRMMAERLEQQVAQVEVLFQNCGQNLDEVCYRRLARSFGIHINQDAFEELAIALPYRILRKYRTQLFQLEALLFGTAGMLQDYLDEEYAIRLQREYAFLQKKHDLVPLPMERWKFLRLRPSNFPTIRLAQFASLVHKLNDLHAFPLLPYTLKEYESLLKVECSGFWDTHYTLRESSTEKRKVTGKTFIHGIMINTVVPLLFFYSKHYDKNIYKSMALKLLEQLPFEQNALTEVYRLTGFPASHARDSQSIIQLKKYYCDHKKCLDCAIGYQVMKRKKAC